MRISKHLKIIIGSLVIYGHVLAGDAMDNFEFGLIKKQTGEIYLKEWIEVIETDPSLEQVQDRKGVNPFTNEKVVFPGEGKAYYLESGKRVGNISLEDGRLLTTGVPKAKCEQLGALLGAVVESDDRS
jgi:hypothetical protein